MKTYAIALLISSSAAVKVKTHTAAKSAQPTSVNMTQDQKDNCDLTSSLEGDWTRFDLRCPKKMNEPAYDPSNPGLPPIPFGDKKRDENGCYTITYSHWYEDTLGNLKPYHDGISTQTFCDVGDKFQTQTESAVYNWPQSLVSQPDLDRLRDPSNLVEKCFDNYEDSDAQEHWKNCSDKADNWKYWWTHGEDEGNTTFTKNLYEIAAHKYIQSTTESFAKRIRQDWKGEDEKDDEEVDCVYITNDPIFSKKVVCNFKSTGKPAVVATQTASYENDKTTYQASVDFTEYHSVPANIE